MSTDWLLRISLLALLFTASCGMNSSARCEEVCTWWHQYCTGEDFDACMDDCKWADESAASVIERCVEGGGWGTPSSCRSASCCVRFVYWEDQYQRQCVQN